MNTIISPLTLLVWAMGFFGYAQNPCLDIQWHGKSIFLKCDRATLLFESQTRTYCTNPPTLLANVLPRNSKQGQSAYVCMCVGQPVGNFGLEALRTGIWKLDFDAGTLCRISEGERDSLTKALYVKIPARVTPDEIRIELLMQRVSHHFLFDTGFEGTLSMKQSAKLPFVRDTHETIMSGNGATLLFRGKVVRFLEGYLSTDIVLSDRNRVGLGFIKSFNWIFDLRRGHIYVRKSTLGIDAGHILPDYFAEVKNGRLLITARNAKARRFSIGSEIVSVDAVVINASNACEYAHRLQDASAWNASVQTHNP